MYFLICPYVFWFRNPLNQGFLNSSIHDLFFLKKRLCCLKVHKYSKIDFWTEGLQLINQKDDFETTFSYGYRFTIK